MAGWQNPDVHARTAEMREQLIREFSYLPQLTQLYTRCFESAVEGIKAYYKGDREVEACLAKMVARKDIVDRDLYPPSGISPAGLLALVWEEKIKPNEAYEHFLATLKDMGTTCPQGDSHRLFATFVAFSRC